MFYSLMMLHLAEARRAKTVWTVHVTSTRYDHRQPSSPLYFVCLLYLSSIDRPAFWTGGLSAPRVRWTAARESPPAAARWTTMPALLCYFYRCSTIERF